MSTKPIAREDVLQLKIYAPPDQAPNTIRLNANEAPESSLTQGDASGLNRYPEVRPLSLQAKMADLFDIPKDNLLVTRGSSEAIDILIRTYCRAYQDSLVTMVPTFELYGFYARVQGAEMIEVPLRADDFAFDRAAVLDACQDNTKLIVICSPNNPTGGLVTADDILAIVRERRGRSVVVVDEAYIEFSGAPSMAAHVAEHDNLIVLRTLSKAHALAGARCGGAIANEATVDVIRRVMTPYSFSTPVTERVMGALSDERLAIAGRLIDEIVAERERMTVALMDFGFIERVWPSHGNFVLARVSELNAVQGYLQSQRILVRSYGQLQHLANCLRITIGSTAENNAVLAALADYEGTR